MTTATDITTLIVDDQPDIRLLMKMLVEAANEGLVVAGEAASGAEAIEQARRIEPRVIVFDEMMPAMNGMEAAMRVREDRPSQVMILCSAYLDDAVINRARSIGFDAWLAKEDVVELPDLIRRVVAHRGGDDAGVAGAE
ncbi:MAG: response regulator [Frankiales bacterium]|nr:response regulator [Frankiales bacterium]